MANINNDTQNFNRLFQENPVIYNKNDRYFYKLEEDNRKRLYYKDLAILIHLNTVKPCYCI